MKRLSIPPGLVAEATGYITGRAGSLAIAAFVGIVVARHLGPADLGLLGFAASVNALMIPIALLGMRQVLVREFSTSDRWRTTLASALSRQIPVAVLASGIGFLIIAVSSGWERSATLVAVAFLPLPVLAVKDSIEALHEASGHVKLVVGTAIAAAATAGGLKLGAVIAGAAVWFFAAATTLEALLILIGLTIGMRRRLGPADTFSSIDNDTGRSLWRESWPLLIAAVSVTLYMRVDLAMLGILAGDTETGLYVAASRISEIWYFLPVAAMAAIRPRLSATYGGGDMARYDRDTQRTLTSAWTASIAAVAVTLLLGAAIIQLLYGTAFAGAEVVLRIHILAAPFVFLGVAASQWFIDHRMTRFVMVRSLVAAGVNVILNLALIPSIGAEGAAVATLVSYALGVLLNVFHRRARPVFVRQLKAMVLVRV